MFVIMENMIYKNKDMRLFPNYFKAVGIVVAASPIVITVLVKLLLPAFTNHIMALLMMDLIIVGLFIMAASKEKIEDERIMLIRLKAMAFAFVFAIINTIVLPFVSGIFGDLIESTKGEGVILNMLLMYHIWFLLLKRAGNEKYVKG